MIQLVAGLVFIVGVLIAVLEESISGSLRGSLVTSEWKSSKRCSTSCLERPFTASVISEAEAVEMAQPAPSKRTSSTRSPSILR